MEDSCTLNFAHSTNYLVTHFCGVEVLNHPDGEETGLWSPQ